MAKVSASSWLLSLPFTSLWERDLTQISHCLGCFVFNSKTWGTSPMCKCDKCRCMPRWMVGGAWLLVPAFRGLTSQEGSEPALSLPLERFSGWLFQIKCVGKRFSWECLFCYANKESKDSFFHLKIRAEMRWWLAPFQKVYEKSLLRTRGNE